MDEEAEPARRASVVDRQPETRARRRGRPLDLKARQVPAARRLQHRDVGGAQEREQKGPLAPRAHQFMAQKALLIQSGEREVAEAWAPFGAVRMHC